MAPISTHKTAYQKTEVDGKTVSKAVSMHSIDAHHAVASFPKEWSFKPWDDSEGVNQVNGEPRATVPNDWVDLKPSDRIKLARELGAHDVRSGAAADEFINGYLVERANAGVTKEPEPKPEPAEVQTEEFI